MLHPVTWKTRLAGIAAAVFFTGLAQAAEPVASTPSAAIADQSVSAQLLQLIDGLRSGLTPTVADIESRHLAGAEPLALSIAALNRELNQLALGYGHRRRAFEPSALLSAESWLATDDDRRSVRARMDSFGELIDQFELDTRDALKRGEAAMTAAYAQTPDSVRRDLPKDFVPGLLAKTRKTLREYMLIEKSRLTEVLDLLAHLDRHHDQVSLRTDPSPHLAISNRAVEKKFRAQVARVEALTQRLVAMNFLPEVQLELSRPKFVPAIQSAPPASSASSPANENSSALQPNTYAAAQFAKLMRGIGQGIIPSDEQVKVLRIGDMEPWVLAMLGFHRGMNELGNRYQTQMAEFVPNRLLTAQNVVDAPARKALRGKLAAAAKLVTQYDADAQAFLQRSEAAMAEAYLKIPASDRAAFSDPLGTLPVTRMRQLLRRYVDLEQQRQAETLGVVQMLDDHADGFRLSEGAPPRLEFLDDALLQDFRARGQRIDALGERIQALFAGPIAQNEQAERQLDEKIRTTEGAKP